MKKPTFFISSTIYDFDDLRGAIKYALEQRGCSVLASEFNDFRKPLDRHSYDACLKSIEQADYFILLIGTRVGGWYDTGARISITQQEYRAAYELQRAGRLKIVSFVRGEVWQFRDDHKALQKHLATLALDDAMKRSIQDQSQRHVEDADVVVKFIEEVSRNRETADAVRNGGVRPAGNWIHVLDDFRDIADVLNTLFLVGFPAEEAAFRRALRHELVEILRACLMKSKRVGTVGPRWYIEQFDQAFEISDAEKHLPSVCVPTEAWDRFSTIMMHWLRGKIHTIVLHQALTSSTFLRFDAQTGTCQETPVFQALFRLEQEVRD